MEAAYDAIGTGYGAYRRPDPRWAARIEEALGDARTVINVGAGTGSYEPRDRRVVAVEPSQVMIDQRPADAAPVCRATAESLPFPDRTFDAALALLTVHHWPDAARGLAELRRVADRQVVFTWDPTLFARRYWFVAEYLPEHFAREAALATLDTVVAHLAPATVETLAVPADCTDGVFGAYWRRPDALLDPRVRSAISGLALVDQSEVTVAIDRLRDDLNNGSWETRHTSLHALDELDLGYRLVVSDQRTRD